MSKRLGDHIKPGTAAEFRDNIHRYAMSLAELATQIHDLPQTKRTAFLSLLLRYASYQTEQLAEMEEPSTGFTAWIARNLFESFLMAKYALSLDEEVIYFRRETGRDEKELLEGILSLSEGRDDLGQIGQPLKDRIAHIEHVLAGLGTSHKRLHARELAEKVDMADEYTAFWKLYSKYLHPTPFVISRQDSNEYDDVSRLLLNLNIQLYLEYLSKMLADHYQFTRSYEGARRNASHSH